MFNLLPDVMLSDFIKSMNITTNDQMLVVYLASLIRSSIALHNLIDNKITNRLVLAVLVKNSSFLYIQLLVLGVVCSFF